MSVIISLLCHCYHLASILPSITQTFAKNVEHDSSVMIEDTNEQKYSGKLWYSKEQELQIKIQLWAPCIGLERQVVNSIRKKDMEHC